MQDMQQIRGYIYFEETGLDRVVRAFADFEPHSMKSMPFWSLTREGKEIDMPGIYVFGDIEDFYSSKDFVMLMRQQVGLAEDYVNCDISVSNENRIIPIKEGDVKGNYIGIRILPPYDLSEIVYPIANQLSGLLEASNVSVRTVETHKDKFKPTACLDIFTPNKFSDYEHRVLSLLTGYGLFKKEDHKNNIDFFMDAYKKSLTLLSLQEK